MTSKIGEVAKASRRLPKIEESIKEAQVGFSRWGCVERVNADGWFVESVGCC